MRSERAVRHDEVRDPESGETGRERALPRLLTLSEVAAYFRVDPKTVRRWAAMRRIPCVRLGNRLRFDPGDIVSWVRQRKEG